ncbi:hypothetical protein KDK_36000 [Dictyobacter kobayashii]|uniref:Bacterial transcriptional activator domain-containing protein n=1 Tax=Dictyobacter kobayashii TaxID=2014872 RepID=A0A402ALB7_9CHLR|nr:hypothetical protein KDK_36000 [Dictyobacter kobayashii]
MSSLLEQERDYEAAIAVALKLLRLDPLDESTYRYLMQLYVLNGDRVTALRTYQTCASTLERELGVEPDASTREMYERLMQASPSLAKPVSAGTTAFRSSTAPMVGRQRAWAELQSAWQHVVEGESTVVIVAGEAGIGKSRLVEEMRFWVQQQGMLGAIARCYAAEDAIAYTPITTWLKHEALKKSLNALPDLWLCEIARLIPALLLQHPYLPHPEPLQDVWQQQRLFDALAQALLNTPQPLLLVLDDLQWTDRDTLIWLHYLLRSKDPRLHLLLVCTLRVEEITAEHSFHTWFASLQREIPVTQIQLERLNSVETAKLAAFLGPEPLTPDMQDNLYRETEGNPLFIVETVRARTFTLAETVSAAHKTSTFSLPSPAQAVLTTRLAQLSPVASELTNLASVIGRSFTLDVLVQASGHKEDMIVPGLDELWQRRIIYEQSEGSYDFSHDKLRETAYQALSTLKRRRLHYNVADAVLTLYADQLDAVSGQLAFHYERAGLTEKALLYYERASVAALQIYANMEASKALQRAIDLHYTRPQPQITEIARLRERLGDIFHLTGQSDACLEMYQKVIALLSSEHSRWLARIHRKIASHWNSVTNPAASILSYQEAEHLLYNIAEEEKDLAWQQELLQMKIGQVWTLNLLNRFQEMVDILGQIQQPIEQIGTLMQKAQYFQCLCLRDSRQMRYHVDEQVINTARLALSICQKSGHAGDIGNFMYTLGSVLMWAGQLVEAETYLQTGLTLEEQVGDITLQLFGLFFLTMLFRRQKQPDKARQCVERLLRGPYPGYGPMAYACQAWLAWKEDRLVEAQRLAEFALAGWQHASTSYPFLWTALWPLIAIAVCQERVAVSIAYVHQLLDPAQEAHPAALTEQLERAVQLWENKQPEQAQVSLLKAIEQAQVEGYL